VSVSIPHPSLLISRQKYYFTRCTLAPSLASGRLILGYITYTVLLKTKYFVVSMCALVYLDMVMNLKAKNKFVYVGF